MIYTELTKKAMRICYDVHKDQLDKSGLPYVLHPLHLAEQMDDEYATCVALLHDTVEDSDEPIQILEMIVKEFPLDVTGAVCALTRKKDISYMDYVRKIKENPLATKVKLADLEHNSDLSRLNVVTEKDEQRVKKYKKAIKILIEE